MREVVGPPPLSRGPNHPTTSHFPVLLSAASLAPSQNRRQGRIGRQRTKHISFVGGGKTGARLEDEVAQVVVGCNWTDSLAYELVIDGQHFTGVVRCTEGNFFEYFLNDCLQPSCAYVLGPRVDL
jgi:hypothetical protein